MTPPIHRPGALTAALFVGALSVAGLAGCSTPETVQRPEKLASSTSMQQDPDRPGAWIYRAPNADFRRYTRFIVEPAEIYRGSDANYAGLTNAQLSEIAQLLTSETRSALGGGYPITKKPGPGTARIVMKLVGAEETIAGVATASRILPIGAVANAIESNSGGSGSFTGSVIVAVEAYDTQTSKLVAAAVRRYTPAVFDMQATLSTMDTARAAARAAAQDVRAAVDRAHGRTPPPR